MRTRTLLVLLVITLIAAFTVLNWPVFIAPTTLSVGLTSFEAPLGLTLLGVLIALTLIFAIYMAVWQASILRDTRRHTKEMQAQRALADQAEASRFTELRNQLHTEIERLAEQVAKSQASLRTEIRDSSNSLAAMVAELDDRLKRGDAGDH